MSTPRQVTKLGTAQRVLVEKNEQKTTTVVKPNLRNIQFSEDVELTPTNKRLKEYNFEFNAPKFHDFTAPETLQDNDDIWFGNY
jgi:hypothetical protein